MLSTVRDLLVVPIQHNDVSQLAESVQIGRCVSSPDMGFMTPFSSVAN